MADLYIVHFEIGGEPTDAKFEFLGNAIALAELLAEAGIDSTVVDHFGATANYDRMNVVVFEDGERVEDHTDDE